jgi:hypothetical protein
MACYRDSFYIQTDSGVQSASYPMVTGGSFPRSKAAGYEADHSPPTSAKEKKSGAIYIHYTISLHGILLN